MDIYVLAGLLTTMGLVNGIGLINNHKKVPSIDDKTGKSGANSNNENNKADAEKAKADAEKAKADAEKAKADADKAKADADKAKADADKAKVAAGAAAINIGSVADTAAVAARNKASAAAAAAAASKKIPSSDADTDAASKKIPSGDADADAASKKIPSGDADADAASKKIPSSDADADAASSTKQIQLKEKKTNDIKAHIFDAETENPIWETLFDENSIEVLRSYDSEKIHNLLSVTDKDREFIKYEYEVKMITDKKPMSKEIWDDTWMILYLMDDKYINYVWDENGDYKQLEKKPKFNILSLTPRQITQAITRLNNYGVCKSPFHDMKNALQKSLI
jgi:hypothetical protein